MPGAVTTPLEERVARYHRIVELRDGGMSLKQVGEQFDPPLPKQLVSRILKLGPPRSQSGGRPRRDTQGGTASA